MDRFIVKAVTLTQIVTMYLKSNMDRFIALQKFSCRAIIENLKSNMDRFIENRTHNLQYFKMI